MIGSESSQTVQGALLSARVHGLEHELLGRLTAVARYPQHVFDSSEVAVHEPLAGYLRPERAIAAAVRCAETLGADVHESVEVLELQPYQGGTRIITTDGEWLAQRVVLCAGAWTSKLAPTLKPHLTVERVAMVWHAAQDPDEYAPDRCPVWIHEMSDGTTCYGFPSTDGRTVKLATHHRGTLVDPDTVDRQIHREDIEHVESFVRDRLRGLRPELVNAEICMYTNTPDFHFALGELPGRENIVLVSACSGHGFKFATVIGEIAGQLAAGQESPFDLSIFDPRRFYGFEEIGGTPSKQGLEA